MWSDIHSTKDWPIIRILQFLYASHFGCLLNTNRIGNFKKWTSLLSNDHILHYLSRSEVHLWTEAFVTYKSMSLQGVQKVILRSLLRQTRILKKSGGSIWLQPFPNIDEFQTSSESSAHKDLKGFIRTFPESMHDFLKLNIPSRIVNGNDVYKMVITAYKQNPLKDAPNNVEHALNCLKIVNGQVIHLRKLCLLRFPE